MCRENSLQKGRKVIVEKVACRAFMFMYVFSAHNQTFIIINSLSLLGLAGSKQ